MSALDRTSTASAGALTLYVNGQRHDLEGLDGETPLLWVIRDHIGLTGTKFGCGIAMCGACTVHLDGRPVRSCSVTAASANNAHIETIEGVQGRVASAVRRSWIANSVPQCGYCQSGQIMSAIGLLTETPRPTPSEVDLAMTGNLCRCGTYPRIRAAILEAAESIALSRG